MSTRSDPADFVRGLLPTLSQATGSRLPAVQSEKLPVDTVRVARVPAGVHLALIGTARAVDLEVRVGAPTWRSAPTVGEVFMVRCSGTSHAVPLPADAGVVHVDLPARSPEETVRIYLPETVELELVSITAKGGDIAPAQRGPRWVVCGDSIAQGWSVTEAGMAWPSLVAASLGLDLVNLGFAGSARGELPVADVIAESEADAVTLAWGTNSYSTIPTDAAQIAETMRVFLTAVRQGLPDAPLIVISPIIRPDAETTPNRFGTTHRELRAALESAVLAFAESHHDDRVVLVHGRDIVPANALTEDGVHPGDEGHAHVAAAVEAYVAAALGLRCPRPEGAVLEQ